MPSKFLKLSVATVTTVVIIFMYLQLSVNVEEAAERLEKDQLTIIENNLRSIAKEDDVAAAIGEVELLADHKKDYSAFLNSNGKYSIVFIYADRDPVSGHV